MEEDMKDLNRDKIDFENTNIGRLFTMLLMPTLMGLIFGALLNVADGIFVGKGVGSNALAAVNVAAPIYLLASATSLMFGTGVSIIAAVHMSHRNYKAANINVTQAFAVPSLLMLLLGIVIYAFAPQLCYLFGGSAELEPLVVTYLRYICPIPLFSVFFFVGAFVIRLDGSPRYAMICNIIPSLLNIFLDWLLVFPLDMGLKGAAMATSISMMVGAVMAMCYFTRFAHVIRLYKVKTSRTSLYLTARNISAMIKLGLATFIGDTAITFMIIAGNYMFMKNLHEDGVAAWSVCCYLFPLVFMFGSAVVQSQLPIISFNHGLGRQDRVNSTFRISVGSTAICGAMLITCCILGCKQILGLFLDEESEPFHIATEGFPTYSIGFLFFSLNIVVIGFYQSLGLAKESNLFMLLRGLILLIPSFVLLPECFGTRGLWLAVPASEFITLSIIAVCTFTQRRKLFGTNSLQDSDSRKEIVKNASDAFYD